MSQKPNLFITKEVLEDLYCNQLLIDSEIGKRYGVTHRQVGRLRKRYNINTIERIDRNGLSKEILYNEYSNQKLYDWQIGEKYGFTAKHISYLRIKYNIPTITESERNPLITKEQIINEYLINKKSIKQISNEYHIAENTIIQYKNNFNIKSLDKIERNNCIYPNDDEYLVAKQIVLGTILGDAHLNKIKKNVRLEMKHYELQKEWLNLKNNYAKSFLSMSEIEIVKYRSGYSTRYEQYRSYSKVHSWLTDIYSLLYYSNGVKYINREYLNMLNEVGIATWIIDDGTYSKKTYHLATDCFNLNDHIIMKQYFKEKWDLECSIVSVTGKKEQYRLYFNVKSSIVIRYWVENLIGHIPLMKHKYSNVKLKDLLNISENNQTITEQESVVNL